MSLKNKIPNYKRWNVETWNSPRLKFPSRKAIKRGRELNSRFIGIRALRIVRQLYSVRQDNQGGQHQWFGWVGMEYLWENGFQLNFQNLMMELELRTVEATEVNFNISPRPHLAQSIWQKNPMSGLATQYFNDETSIKICIICLCWHPSLLMKFQELFRN